VALGVATGKSPYSYSAKMKIHGVESVRQTSIARRAKKKKKKSSRPRRKSFFFRRTFLPYLVDFAVNVAYDSPAYGVDGFNMLIGTFIPKYYF
jgi:hypothetical protein